MVSYFELGKTRLAFQNEGRVALNQKQQNEVDRLWSEIKTKNPSAFNGGVWTCLGFNENGRTVNLRVAQTDYATATCARRKNWQNGLTMGTGTFVLEGDDVVFAQRSTEVVADPGKISMAAGGVVDTKTAVVGSDHQAMILAQMEKELDEELRVRSKTEIVPIGLAIGPGSKAEWCGAVFVNGPQIKDKKEAVQLIKVPRRNLEEFIGDNRTKFELSTLWHLEYWGDRIAKTDRLDFLK